jgi:predicted Rdx family selenoprotein
VSLANEILGYWAPLMEEVGLRAGQKGHFEVSLDGKLLFSKAQLGRKPKPGEIRALMEPIVGPPENWR